VPVARVPVMRITTGERGATLIEAVLAGGLLITLAIGTAALITLARRLGAQSEQLMAATSIAAGRLQTLRAIPWDYGLDGAADEVARLALSPGEALDRNTPGVFEVTDDAGQSVTSPGAGGAAFTVRLAMSPATGAGPETRSIEVCVFAWPAVDGAPPLVCLASARTRQP
jgi:HAMP domain-containing protein